MDQDTIIKFLRKNDVMKISSVERNAGVPQNSLQKAMKDDSIKLKQDHVDKIANYLMKYGLASLGECKIISIVNNKGGVGKTVTTANLGKALSILKQKVLVVDLDPQGNLSQHFNVRLTDDDLELVDLLLDKEIKGKKVPIKDVIHNLDKNLDLLPSTILLDQATLTLQASPLAGFKKLDQVLSMIASDYDYILIDCMPSLGILTGGAITASTEVIIPLNPDGFSANGINNVLNLIESVQPFNNRLSVKGFVVTKKQGTTLISKQYDEQFRESLTPHYKVFDTVIRMNTHLSEAASIGMDIFSYYEENKKDIRKMSGKDDYMNLAIELMNSYE